MKEQDLKLAYNDILSQTISASQRYLFCGNIFGDIFVLDLMELDKESEAPPGKLDIYPQGSKVDVNCLAFHNEFLIVGNVGSIYALSWDEANAKLSSKRVWEIKIPMQVDAVEVPDVNSLWLRPGTDTLYAGCGDSVVYQIKLEEQSIEREYRGHTDYIHTVVGKPNGSIFTASEDGTVRFWHSNQKEAICEIEPYKHEKLLRYDWGKWIGDVAVSDDWLICGGGPRAAIWYLNSKVVAKELEFPGRVHVCEFVDDHILIAGEHDHMHLYDMSGEVRANIPVEHTACYSAVWQLKPFKFMSVAGFSNKLHILKDFRFLDSKIDLYGNTKEENIQLSSDSDSNSDDSDSCDSVRASGQQSSLHNHPS